MLLTGVLDWRWAARNPFFWGLVLTLLLNYGELVNWVKQDHRGDVSDLALIALLFFAVYLATGDLFNSLLGALSIYLLFGLIELKDYSVLNRLALITLITYNVIFFASFFGDKARDTAFSMSFWLILLMGFAFFGRRYLVVWRFMSPQYLTLGLYFVAWLAVSTISEYTPLKLTAWIYEALILTNFILYFVSGPLLGRLLGIKPVQDTELESLVAEVSEQLGLKRVVKVGFASYPIINAMAFGSVLDPRIGIIAEDLRSIDREELKGIVAHELAHLRGRHTLTLTLITAGDLAFRKVVGIPATYYDYVFSTPKIPMLGFILINVAIFVVLYVFVRMLEARADLSVKKLGLGPNLARALYTLEGFYASGREVGLNTVLLCDERLLPENRQVDYYETGRYVASYLVRPSRLSVLANLLNSHPPSPVRMAAMFVDVDPSTEAMYTFTLMRCRNLKRFGRKMSEALPPLNEEMVRAFHDKFGVDDLGSWNERLGKLELFNTVLDREFLFLPKGDGRVVWGRVTGVSFRDDFLGAVLYEVALQEGGTVQINPILYQQVELPKNGKYLFRNRQGVYRLRDVLTEPSDPDQTRLVFRRESEADQAGEPEDETVSVLPRKRRQLPFCFDVIVEAVGKVVFQKFEGGLKPWLFIDVELEPNGVAKFHFSRNDGESLELEGGDAYIFPRRGFFVPTGAPSRRAHEAEVLEWMASSGVRVTAYLKKPVNNVESGKVVGYDADPGEGEDPTVTILTVFGKKFVHAWKEVEGIAFEEPTMVFQLRSEASFLTRLWHGIHRFFAPRSVFAAR